MGPLCYYQAIRMGIERGNLGKLDERRKAALNLPPEEPLGASIKELLTDDNFKVFLSAELKKSGAPLFNRVLEGTTTAKDEEKLIDLQRTYTERSKNAEALIGMLDDYMSEMLKGSPLLKDLAESHGLEAIEKVLRDGLFKRALTDPKKFAVLQDEFKKLRDFENDVEKPLNKRLDDWCKKNNVTLDNEKLDEALREKNPGLRQAWIQDELTKGLKFKQRLWDATKGIFGGGTRGEARRLSDENIPQVLDQRDQIVKDAGEYARTLLIDDKEFREALARTRIDKEPVFEGTGASMMSFAEVKGFKLDMKAASDELNVFLTKKGKSVEWDRLGEQEKETLLGEFWNGNNETEPDKAWDGYKDRFPRPKGGGFMATLLSYMFGKDFYKDEAFKEELKKFEA